MNKLTTMIMVMMLTFAGASQVEAEESVLNEEVDMPSSIKIKLASVFVEDQEKAQAFYTEILGFVVKDDVPVGEYKWLTVVASDDSEGTELLLEPNVNEAASAFQKAIFDQGIPATAFFCDDIQAEFERLTELGVRFTTEPTSMGEVKVAIFDDTCGNLIQLVQK